MGRPMKKYLRILGISLVAASAFVLAGTAGVSVVGSQSAMAQADEPQSLNQLLEAVRQGRIRENRENRQREEEFRRDQANQQRLLNQAQADLEAEREEADRLEATFQENEQQISLLQEELRQTLGAAGELFGTVRQVAGDTIGQVKTSLVSAQYPNRGDALESLTRGRVLPTVRQLELLWYVLFEEMVAQGKIVSFESEFFTPRGEQQSGNVVRIGPFTAMRGDNGDFLKYNDETDSLQLLARQPAGRFMDAADALVRSDAGELTTAAIDPSQGTILGLLVQTPNLLERIEDGRLIGYIIIGLGALGIVLAVFRLIGLSILSVRVKSQMRNPENPGKGNPLGRMLLVYEDLVKKGADEETIELKLDEQFLKEKPALEWGLGTVKVLAAVAPLLGLLGTVTGMIVVFQQITLFGTGDPKLMAGGISQALVTTVLGLCAAIPLLLLHSITHGRAKEVEHVLEEQSAGLVAARAEQRH